MKKEYLKPEVNEINFIMEGNVMAGSKHHCTHATTCDCGGPNSCEPGIHQGCGNCPDCPGYTTNY